MFDANELIRLVERIKSQDVDESIISELDAVALAVADAQMRLSVSANAGWTRLRDRLGNEIENSERTLLTKRGMEPAEREAEIERVQVRRDFLRSFDPSEIEVQMDGLAGRVRAIASHVDGSEDSNYAEQD